MKTLRTGFVVATCCLLTLALPNGSDAGQDTPPPDVTFLEASQLDALFAATPIADLAAQPSEPETHPAPQHTGFAALVRSTASDFAWFPRRRSTYVLLGIGGAAAAIAYPFDTEINEELQEAETLKKVMKPGKYLGYGWVQASAAIGLYVAGRYWLPRQEDGSRNKMAHLGFDLLRANIVSQALTYGVKVAVRRDRPTGECCSFPSGHASVTFATASVLERHFGYRASWPMFAIAGYVAASRLTENRHYLSDVLFGSALGMASGWTVVGRHGRDNFALYPVPVRGGVALSGMWSPGRTAAAY